MYESLFWWVEAEKSEIVLKWTCWLVEMLCDQGSLCQSKIPKRFGFAQNSFLWSAQNSGLLRVVVNVAKEGSGGETGYNEAVSAQARPATTFLQSHTLYHCNLLSICTCLFNCWLFSESCCWFILWKRVVPWTTFIPKLLLQRGKKQVDNKELLPTRRFKGTNVENKKRLEYWVVSTETLTGHKLAMPIYVCFCTWTSRSLK